VAPINAWDERRYRQKIILDKPGNYRAKFVVDTRDVVDECREDNNTRYLDFKVTGSGGQSRLPELSVYAIGVNPRKPCIDDVVTFSAQVKNTGTATAAPSKLSLRIGGGTPVILSVPAIDPGKYATVTKTESLSRAQRYRVTARADYDNKIAESNEGNNVKSSDFEVFDHCCPDLWPHRMWVLPANPTVRDTIEVNVWVRNSGRRPTTATDLKIYVGGSSRPYTFSVAPINAWDERRYSQKIILDRPGKYRAKFVVDPRGDVDECKEDNNTRYLDFEVKR
jgi:subtilase family serine protease